MKRKFTLLAAALMLLSCLAVPLGMWGQTRSISSLVFTAKCNGSGTANDGVVWTVTSDGTESNFVSDKGIHYGTNSAKVQYIQLSTSEISGTITKVVVNASTASGVSATVGVTVGGSAFGGNPQSLSTTATDYTFNGSASGEIVVLITKPSSATKALYCKSIEVTYDGSTPVDPEIQIAAEELQLDWQAIADGTFNVTYTNDFEPYTATAKLYNDAEGEEEFDGNWIELVEEDLSNPNVIEYSVEANTGSDVRPVYLHVEAMDESTNVIEAMFTITQAAQPTYTVTYSANGGSGTMTDVDSPYHEGDVVVLLDNDFTAPDGMVWDSWQVKDADNNDVEVVEGMFEMPAKNVTVTAQWVADPNAPEYEWVLTDLADLTSSDVFVIVGDNGNTYAMPNNGGASAPTATAITVANGKLSAAPANNLKWNVSGNNSDGYIFRPNGSTTTYLYGLNSNNGIRVGTGSGAYSNLFTLSNNGYLTFVVNTDTRYVGIYSSQDWRCYTSVTGTSNIAGQTFGFYKRQVVTNDPSITAEDVNIGYNATSGEIAYTITNPDGSNLTAAEKAPGYDWIGNVTVVSEQNKVTFTTTANDGASREGYITLTYGTLTKDVKVTQAGAPKTVTYNANGGTGSAVVKNYVYGDNVTILNYNHGDINFTAPTGKVFKNWNTATNGTGTTFAAGATISGINANYTLYAQWEDFPTYTLATSIENGRHYIITNGLDKAMGGQNTNNRAAVGISITDGTATVTSTDVYEFVINGPELMPNGYEVYTIYDVNNSGYLYAASNSSNWLRNQGFNDDNGRWRIEFNDGAAEITAQGDNSHCYMRYNSSGSGLFSCYGSGQDDIYLYKKNETTPQYDFYKDIAAHTDATGAGNTDGWYFIASPLASAYTPAGSMIANNTYDLYRLSGNTWENFKNTNHADFTTLQNGQGYLYANSANTTLHFSGAINTFTTEGEANVKNLSTGWNLIGNPYNIPIYINKPYYKMNAAGTAVKTSDGITSVAIPACAGVVVYAGEGESVTFSISAPSLSTGNNGNIQMTLAQHATNRGNATTLDNAIVSFNEGGELEKFYFGTQNANLYIPQGTEEYAIVSSEAQGEMPVSFRANENGQYTLTVNAENVEMNYLHLIDNMTGADIDLLQTPSYTFNAKTTDYESRFRLVFSANNSPAENGNETFAYFNGSEWMISNMGEATLQVVDVMGRVLSTKTVNGNATINLNQTPGVYMFRLINGDSVKVQKVVVR